MTISRPVMAREKTMSHRFDSRKWVLALSMLVAAASVFLRAYNLLVFPIFTDEATYLRWAADIFDKRTAISLFIPVADDGKQPMYIWLATGAMFITSDPLLAGRIVLVVTGALSMMGIMLSGRWLEDRLLGLIAGFLYAIVPYVLFFDRMALADGIVSSTAIWAFGLGVFLAVRARSGRSALLVGAALGAVIAFGVWVKPTALFELPLPVLCLLLLPREGRPLRRPIWGLVVAYSVFAALASLLIVMPYAENQLRLLATHVYSPEQLVGGLPIPVWINSARDYWLWIQAYLPAPLYWVVLAASAWGLVYRRRETLLLLGCWAADFVPSVLLAHYFSSRYVLQSVFPLLLLAALGFKEAGRWLMRLREKFDARRGLALGASISAAVAVAVTAPSVSFDLHLLTDPPSAAWPADDREQYVEGWSSGYGFSEALNFTLQRAKELGGVVFVLSDNFQGFPDDGLALYIRNMPLVRHYVDGRIMWGGKDLANAWRSHDVPLLIVRDDGRFHPEKFEENIPEAKRLAIFWKPGKETSFRVYEMDLRDAKP